jgi:DNA-binding CsgD family transcriptional regulator
MPGQETLTARETEILGLLAKGKTSKEIAEALGLSIFTVNNHRKHICRKLGLHSTAELVAYAAQSTRDN